MNPTLAKPGINYALMAFVTLAACLALFALDKDTHSFANLLKPGNLSTLFIYIYFTLSFLLCFLRCYALLMRKNKKYSLVLAPGTGVPLAFTGNMPALSAHLY